MARHGIQYTSRGRDGYEVTLTTAQGSLLRVAGTRDAGAPEVAGDIALRDNPALVSLLWKVATHEWQFRRSRSDEVRASHRKQVDRATLQVNVIARMVDQLRDEDGATVTGWCSACFERTTHVAVRGFSRPLRTYLCASCGSPTTRCAAARCTNMANRPARAAAAPAYCAEHRHEVPSFERLGQHLGKIDDYAEWLSFDKKNLARATRVASVVTLGGLVVAPMAAAAAPMIGGALGAATGLTGAAATSHGLALLGGGSIAAGGLGMAGGTTVVTAMGAGLGGLLGGLTTANYVRSDPSFRIEKLREGRAPAVLVANGFLTEGTEGWGGWRAIVDARYPDNAVYRIHWGAKELKSLAVLAGGALSKQAAKQAVLRLAKRASKKTAAGVPFLGPLMVGTGLVANPWHVAKNRANMTGAILADLIARTDDQRFVLVGHSLGARVMATAAQTLGTRQGAPKVESIHLLGAAVAAGGDLRTLADAVHERVHNYHSRNDAVLKFLYRLAQGGGEAAGVAGFTTTRPKIKNHDVTKRVDNHSRYVDAVTLARSDTSRQERNS